MLAYTYPLLDVFWSMLIFFLFFMWIWLLITIFIDIFRSPELSGWGKALWFLFVLVIPLVGVLVYLIARGKTMHEHQAAAVRQQDTEFRQYVQDVAASDGNGSVTDQLAKLADLRDRGVITEEEFNQQKVKVLA
jgi:Short C-terminal domain/Phospholipase_D-nuclease N-terminal